MPNQRRDVVYSIQRLIAQPVGNGRLRRPNLLIGGKKLLACVPHPGPALIPHTGQSSAEKSLEAFAYGLILGDCGSNCLLRQGALIA
jgi:hypothetical protein